MSRITRRVAHRRPKLVNRRPTQLQFVRSSGAHIFLDTLLAACKLAPVAAPRLRGDHRMASRREFLQIGVAALALPISARAGLAPAISSRANESAPTPLYKVIFDERFASSRAFAGEGKRLGASIYGIKGDITDLWFNDLDARWKKKPAFRPSDLSAFTHRSVSRSARSRPKKSP